MIDKTANYLQDIELLKKIELIAERMGLEADAALHLSGRDNEFVDLVMPFNTDGYCFENKRVTTIRNPFVSYVYGENTEIKTYTSSILELLLPEWCFDKGAELDQLLKSRPSFMFDYRYYKRGSESRGKEKVEAIARLIILLDDNDLLET